MTCFTLSMTSFFPSFFFFCSFFLPRIFPYCACSSTYIYVYAWVRALHVCLRTLCAYLEMCYSYILVVYSYGISNLIFRFSRTEWSSSNLSSRVRSTRMGYILNRWTRKHVTLKKSEAPIFPTILRLQSLPTSFWRVCYYFEKNDWIIYSPNF